MNIQDFIENFAAQFDETGPEAFTADTKFKELDEWSSLTAFSLISFIENTYGKKLLLPELLQAQTLDELYKIING